MSVGPTELMLIALVVFLLFGTRRLGDLGKGIGEAIRNFKHGIADEPAPKSAEEKVSEAPKQLIGRIATHEELNAAKVEPHASAEPAAVDGAKPEAKVSAEKEQS